jgi:hypothetical protein
MDSARPRNSQENGPRLNTRIDALAGSEERGTERDLILNQYGLKTSDVIGQNRLCSQLAITWGEGSGVYFALYDWFNVDDRGAVDGFE